jgi:predicted DNA-binding transcriptional regulator AlpA
MQNLRCLLAIRDVCALTGRCRASIYNDIEKKVFPAPLKLGSRSMWLAEDVETFIADLVAARDARVAAEAGRKATAAIRQAARGGA